MNIPEITATIGRTRTGFFHVWLTVGRAEYRDKTRVCYSLLGARWAARRMIRAERRYLTTQTRWVVR